MLQHLDQNHNSLSPPHSKANLILSNTPCPDQSSLISWSAPTRDERPFNQPQQGSASDQLATTVSTSLPAPTPESGPEPAPLADTITPGNAEDPKLSDPPPTSPADATSPAVESSSSLTPPPDTTSPTFPSTGLPDGEAAAKPNVEAPEEGNQAKVEGSAEELEKASRASTPLSELSSAPDGDDPPEGEKNNADDGLGNTESNSKPASQSHQSRGASNSTSDVVKQENFGHMPIAGPSHAETSFSAGPPYQRPNVSRAPSIATPEPAAQTAASNSARKSDPKVVTILELNAELLKVCIEFQSRGISLADQQAQQISLRLQGNLAWLAAAADESRKSSPQHVSLPILDPPSPLPFISTERINHLYNDLRMHFTKDAARRQQGVASASGTPQPLGGTMSNGHLKRERPEDSSGDIANVSKRRDTGESKMSTPGPSTPLSHSSPVQPISSTMAQPATPPTNLLGPNAAGPSNSSPSMPPPSVPPGLVPGMNDAQMAAAQRARQMQLRQMQQQQLQQQQQAMVDGQRQMSPPAVPQGSLSMQSPQAQMAALNSMGPQAIQAMQILQNPQHAITNFLTQQIPAFQSLPIAQQVREVQKFQVMFQARQQRANAQMQGGGSMQGMSQGGGMPGSMGIANGSPTRISPTAQQGAMQGQTGGSQMPGNMGGLDPRMLTQAQQANLANMNPQQRQLLLMQAQSQMMRGANAPNPMMNQQMMNAAQQQRMAAASSPHIGSPMLGGPMDNNLPSALRSNPGVPGIARSTRTPSDHAPSPMTPQLSQRQGQIPDDYQRAMMQQRSMSQSGGMGQMGINNMNPGWPQSQQSAQMAQGNFGNMSPPAAQTGFGGMGGGNPALGGGPQQWSPNGGGSFPFNAGSPAGSMDGPGSRQTSATPAPQVQMAQNSPMGDQTGLNDFDIFNWEQ